MVKYKTPAALEMAVRNAARQSPMDTNRAIAGFYFHRLLCRVFKGDDSHFVLKGGQSVLARTLDARVTRDIDLVSQEESLEEAIADLVQAASIDLDDFVSFVFDRAEQIMDRGTSTGTSTAAAARTTSSTASRVFYATTSVATPTGTPL